MTGELLHLYALISASNARIAAMQAANNECAFLNCKPQYADSWFEAEAMEQKNIADELAQIRGAGR